LCASGRAAGRSISRASFSFLPPACGFSLARPHWESGRRRLPQPVRELSASPCKQTKTKPSKGLFFCFLLFFRFWAFQWVTPEKNENFGSRPSSPFRLCKACLTRVALLFLGGAGRRQLLSRSLFVLESPPCRHGRPSTGCRRRCPGITSNVVLNQYVMHDRTVFLWMAGSKPSHDGEPKPAS
jgi:hypothetical protein